MRDQGTSSIINYWSDLTIQNLKTTKIFNDATKDINSIDFSKDGKYLVASSDDNRLHLYDMENGMLIYLEN